MGLFGFGGKKKEKTAGSGKVTLNSGNVKEWLRQENPEFRRIDDELKYQNKLLDRVNKAREAYKNDKDLAKAIKEYEYAFVKSDPPCKTSQDIDLANLYIKANEYDKAWGYLNQLILRRGYPDSEIKFYQARILKHEEKYAYAIEMIMIGYYYKALPDRPFQTEKFLKDISSSAKKLGWDEEKTKGLLNILNTIPPREGFDERLLINQIRNYMGA